MKPYIIPCIFTFLLLSTNARAQIITTIAGTGISGYSGDGGAATAAQIGNVFAIAIDTAGDIFIAGYGSKRVRKVSTSGIITTIAGTGTIGHSGDGGPATDAELTAIQGIVTDTHGNVFVTEQGTVFSGVRKIDASGTISTIAGTITTGYAGDGGPATGAVFNLPMGLTVDASGNIYVADATNGRVRKINSGAGGIITTIAGNGTLGYSGDGGAATLAALSPYDVAIDAAGNIFIACWGPSGNNYIRKVNTSGIISTIAGIGTAGYSGDGGPATAAALTTRKLHVDIAGNIYFPDFSHRIRKIDPSGIITTIAGTGIAGYNGDGCAADSTQLNSPGDVVLNTVDGQLYIADNLNYRIRKISPDNPIVFTGGAIQYLNVCSEGSIGIDTLLSVSDADIGQGIEWSLLAAPSHGAASVAYTATSTGSIVVPTGLLYNPLFGYSGMDTLRVVATDCGNNSDTTTICVTVDASTDAGTISGADTVCIGTTEGYTNAVFGGAWSSSNTAVCSISSTGVATGVAVGSSTISYTATNSCGTTTSVKDVAVISADECSTSVSNGAASQRGFMQIIPNPLSGGKGTIYIDLPQRELIAVTIVASDGRTIQSFNTYSNTHTQFLLDVPTGLYFIRVVSASYIASEKVLVN